MRQKLFLCAIALVFIGLVAIRVWQSAPTFVPDMPAPLAAAEEQNLHLVPSGKYTLSDIDVNGRTVPSQKYRGFQSRHDIAPKPGDRLCPVTRTRANPSCTWSIGGKIYQFCCPPCIDEFVRLAKQQPDSIQPPEAYVN